jgi:hypothetical protein
MHITPIYSFMRTPANTQYLSIRVSTEPATPHRRPGDSATKDFSLENFEDEAELDPEF